MKPHAILQKDITPTGDDYAIVSHIIERISKDYRDQPSLETLARDTGLSPTALQGLSAGGNHRPRSPFAR